MKFSCKNLFLPILLIGYFSGFAQTTYHTEKVKIARSKIVDPSIAEPDYNVQLLNREAPLPDGKSYKSFLMEQKKKVREKFPVKQSIDEPKHKTGALEPQIGEGLAMYRTYAINGVTVRHSGGIPNDNTLAIGNNGYLLGAINSAVWGYDTNTDTLMFDNNLVHLNYFVLDPGMGHPYDPKLIYDEEADRYILVFLQGNTAEKTGIIVAFSSSNDPRDPWYSYRLPGNPLDNDRWTDFPAISITNEELFITGNLVIPGEPWQIGFDGSVIWQLNKHDGYANADSIRTRFYSDIRTNGRLIRNLHAVTGIRSTAPTQFFLSNRNFDISNDTIFVLQIDGGLEEADTELKITIGKSDTPYGVPPNGRQQDTDQSDPTKGLQTNDARVLGAVTNGDWIQFVSTTVNPSTGLAAIYHGHIQHPATAHQSIQASIIGDADRDYAYPNIAFCGNEACDVETMIGFDYTSPVHDPGVAAIYYNNDSSYSNVVYVKEGEGYVDKHSDSYERWGDYFAIQPRYNQPGKVWIGGFFGLDNRRSGTWFNELGSPDDNQLAYTTNSYGDFQFCEGVVSVFASGGIPPYSYSFNGGAETDSNYYSKICHQDSVFITVKDARGCLMKDTIVPDAGVRSTEGAFPNPFTSTVVAQFSVDSDTEVTAYVLNENGEVVDQILKKTAKKGLNQLVFDLDPLNAGVYFVQVLNGEKNILVSKIFKVE